MTLREQISADYSVAVRRNCSAGGLSILSGLLRYGGFRAALLYRLGHVARKRRLRILSALLGRLAKCGTGADISVFASIDGGLRLPHPIGIVIGQHVTLGKRASILQGVTLGGAGGKKIDGRTQPTVGDDVLIGAGAKLLGPITVGDRVKIGANAVVTHDVPDDATVVTLAARVVRIGEQRIRLSESDDELGSVLRQLQDRVDALERRPS